MSRGDYTIKTAATEYPVTLAYVKEHSKIDYTDEDTVLLGYLKAAIAEAENYANRALMTQTVTQTLDCWPAAGRNIRLYRSPLQSVTHVKYIGTDEAQQTFAVANYANTTVKEPAEIFLKKDKSWPSIATRPEAIEIEYISGYPTADKVPDVIKQAICLYFASFEAKREDSMKRYKSAAESLLDGAMVKGW